jgi:phage major head subunit gpT-like protein
MIISASGLACVVPTSMLFTASEAINASIVDDSSNALRGIARVVSLPWLSDKSKWYLLKTDGVVRPFIFQDREPVEFNAQTQDSDEGFRREKFLYGVRARYRMAYGYWQFGVVTDFS